VFSDAVHQIDIHHIADDPTVKFYNARVFTSNSLLLNVSDWPYSMLQNREEIAAHVSTTVTDAINDARHNFSTSGNIWC
jgi:hypothetical protein